MNLQDIIKVPYSTRPHMSRNTGPVFNTNPDTFYIEQKSHQIKLFGDNLFGATSEAVNSNLVRKISIALDQKETDTIVDLALNFEEDIAIMYNGILSAICFCFPSSWIPKSALGKTLEQIHRPVADGDYLRQASSKLSRTMADPVLGSFRRCVWTITPVPFLSCYPEVLKHYKGHQPNIDNLYFRKEIQTTMPLADGITSVFFVKVEVNPLKLYWNDHKELILSSINSMTDSVLEHKNLVGIKDYLNRLE